MTDRVVVSCPQCARQYLVEPSIDRIVGQCGVCKAHFVMVIPRLTGPAEDALVLDQEIEPHINFFKEACETMARNVCELLRLAGVDITPMNIARIVESLPRSNEEIKSERWQSLALNQTLYHIFTKHLGDSKQIKRLLDYFIEYIPDRSYYSQDMLRSAFVGVLGGIEWPEPDGTTGEAVNQPAISASAIPRKPRRRFFACWKWKRQLSQCAGK